MRRTITIRANGRDVQYDSIWDGYDELAWTAPPPPPVPITFCRECWQPLSPGESCQYCAELRRVKRIRKLLSTRRRGRRLRRRLLGLPGRCADCAVKLPQGWEFRRCEGCLELSRCRGGMSQRRISIGLCAACGERPPVRRPDGRLSTRCESCPPARRHRY